MVAVRDAKARRITWDCSDSVDANGGFCCALTEINGIEAINDPFTTLVAVVSDTDGISPIVFFTSTNKHRAGDNLRNFIHKNKLGRVTRSRGVVNWNDGCRNTVYLYTWIVARRAWQRYANRIRRELYS